MSQLVSFLSGAILFGSATCGVFFLHFWRRTGDRLFGMFGAAFGLLAIERLVLVLVRHGSEEHPTVYLFRLVAFILILIAIVDKNRKERH